MKLHLSQGKDSDSAEQESDHEEQYQSYNEIFQAFMQYPVAVSPSQNDHHMVPQSEQQDVHDFEDIDEEPEVGDTHGYHGGFSASRNLI